MRTAHSPGAAAPLTPAAATGTRRTSAALDPEVSRRLGLLRFPLIVGVVFIHAYETTVWLSGYAVAAAGQAAWSQFVRDFVSQGVARVSVPLFFLMAAYLLFFGFDGSAAGYLSRLRSRVRTLLVPFLFWNVAVLALFAFAQALPWTAALFNSGKPPVAAYGLRQWLDALLGLTQPPIAYQFWFIRDLFLLVLAAPLVHLAVMRIPVAGALALGACWSAGIGLAIPSIEGVFFFYLGAWLGVRRADLCRVDRFGTLLVVAFALLALADAATKGSVASSPLHKLMILAGVAAALHAAGRIRRGGRLEQWLISLSAASFFVFAMHEPALTLARKLAYRLLAPETAAATIALYFAIPLALIAVLAALYFPLKRSLPRLMALATGGR